MTDTGREIAVIDPPEPRGTSIALSSSQREQVAGLIRPVAPPSEVLAAQEETRALIEKALKPERDYGTIPGTKKPSLYKAGGERITAAMGCYPRYRIIEREIDHDKVVEWTKHSSKWGKQRGERVWTEERGTSAGLYRYVVECEIVHRGSGVVIGQGLGSCSTMESKYVDRPRDCENTALKMASKRAFVAAVLNAFGLSDQFTQDVEDGAPAPDSGVHDDDAPDNARVTGATAEQVEFLGKLIKSHVIKASERESILQELEGGLTKERATELIEMTKTVVDGRKAKEREAKKAEAATDVAREPGADDGE